jgi:hypothetical protein
MLVNLYSAKTPIAVLSLPLVVSLLCLPIFFITQEPTQYFIDWQTVLSAWVVKNNWLNYVLTVVLVSTIAHQINNVYNRHVFYSKASFLPGAIYVIGLVSMESMGFGLNLIGHLFLVFGLEFILRIKRQEEAKANVFWASLFIGIAIAFSSFQILLLLLPWLALGSIRPFVWREWFMMLLGAALPMIYYASIIYLSRGGLDLKIADSLVDKSRETNLIIAANYGALALITSGAFFKYIAVMRTQINRFKKHSVIVFHFYWIAVIIWGVGWYVFDLSFVSFLIPLSFVVGTSLLYSKRQGLVNAIVIIWLIISVANVIMTR